MNLPREEHFLPENVIICGIIPGVIKFWGPFREYGDPPVSFDVSSSSIVKVEESAAAMNLPGSAELIIILLGEVIGWLEKYGFASR